jgi:polyisoprenoid-binding protein YceI
MRLILGSESRVLVDLRATGLLRAVGHDPTLLARPEAMELEVGEVPLDLPLRVRFRVDGIEPPADVDASDRDKMRDNMRGRDVLDAARFPVIELQARYRGTFERGRLEGELSVRGASRPLGMDVEVVRAGDEHHVRGTWQGRLTDLGIKPFKALMGALRLEDWIRLRLDARLR